MSKPVTQRIKLYINGKEIDNTLTSIRKNLIKYRNAANKATEGTEDWKKYNKAVAELETEYDNARNAQKAFRQDTKLTTAGISEGQKELANFSSSFSTLFSGLKQGDFLQIQDGFTGVKTGIKGAIKAGLAFIATPIGAAIAVLAGIGLATKEWFNYNEAAAEANKTTAEITQLTGNQLDYARVRAEALSKSFENTSFTKNLETAKKLVVQFGVSYAEAFDIIEDGLVRGQSKNQEYFDSLNEYGVFFNKAGFSAKEFKDIISTGYNLGIYKDKLPDALKEADLAIKEQTKTTKDALVNAFGIAFTEDLLKKVRTGEVTTKQALQSIAKESDKTGINVQQNAQLTADLFKGAGEDAGGFKTVMQAVNTALSEQTKPLTDVQKETKRLTDAHKEMKFAQDNALKSDSYYKFANDISVVWAKTKTFFYNFIGALVYKFQLLQLGIEVAISNIKITLTSLPLKFIKIKDAIVNTSKGIFKAFSHLGDAFNNLKSLNFSAAKQNFSDFTSDVKSSTSAAFKEVDNLGNTIDTLKKKAAGKIVTEFFNSQNSAKEANEIVNTPTADTPTGDTPKGDGEMTAEDKKIIASKQKLKEWLDQWEADTKFQKEIKDIEEDLQKQAIEEEELNNKYAKLELEAAGETELLKRLENAKQADLQAIKDKWAKVALAKLDLKAKKEEELEKKKTAAQKKSAEAEKLLQKQRVAGYANMFGGIAQLLGKNTAAGKAAATAQATINTYQGVSEVWSAKSVLPEPFATASKVVSTGVVLASGLQTVKQINATKTPSLDKGGYTFGGSYTGGMDGIGGQLAMIHPDEYMIPKPVMQMPETPRIVEYLEAKRTGKPIASLAEGGATTELPLPEETTTQPTSIFLINVLEKLLEEIQGGFVLNYTIDDERKRRALAKKLDDTINASKN